MYIQIIQMCTVCIITIQYNPRVCTSSMFVQHTFVCSYITCLYIACLCVCTSHVCTSHVHVFVHHMFVCFVHHMFVCLYVTSCMFVHHRPVLSTHLHRQQLWIAFQIWLSSYVIKYSQSILTRNLVQFFSNSPSSPAKLIANV